MIITANTGVLCSSLNKGRARLHIHRLLHSRHSRLLIYRLLNLDSLHSRLPIHRLLVRNSPSIHKRILLLHVVHIVYSLLGHHLLLHAFASNTSSNTETQDQGKHNKSHNNPNPSGDCARTTLFAVAVRATSTLACVVIVACRVAKLTIAQVVVVDIQRTVNFARRHLIKIIDFIF